MNANRRGRWNSSVCTCGFTSTYVIITISLKTCLIRNALSSDVSKSSACGPGQQILFHHYCSFLFFSFNLMIGGSFPSGFFASHSFHCCIIVSSCVSGELLLHSLRNMTQDRFIKSSIKKILDSDATAWLLLRDAKRSVPVTGVMNSPYLIFPKC
jgi:hypothetical protein